MVLSFYVVDHGRIHANENLFFPAMVVTRVDMVHIKVSFFYESYEGEHSSELRFRHHRQIPRALCLMQAFV